MVTTVAPIFFIYVTDFLFGRSERLNGQISHTGPIFTPKLHYLKMPSFFVEVESWPKCPQLAITLRDRALRVILSPGAPSIVFQRWLRKFHFQHLIFVIFLRFRAEFCNFLNFSCRTFFELGIFKNWSQTSQNDSQDAPGSILRAFEKHHFFHIWLKNFSHYVGECILPNTIKNELSGALPWWIQIKIP